jgi:futalosine hydrolase
MKDINKRPIAILSSIPDELSLVKAKVSNLKRLSITGKIAYKGELSAHDVILLNTGIGKVNAAHSVTLLMEHFSLVFVILCGIGGAYPGSGIEIGDIAIASKEIYGDEGVYGSLRGMEEIDIPILRKGGKRYFNEFPLDKRLVKKAISLGSSFEGIRVKQGPFITLSSVSGTPERAAEVGRWFNAICENMEGAAVAHVCRIYNLPLLEIRGISNIAGTRDRRGWDQQTASKNCQMLVMEFIRSL